MKQLNPYHRRAYVDSADAWKRDVLLDTSKIDKGRAEDAVVAARKFLKAGNMRPTFHWFGNPIDCLAFIATSKSEVLSRKDYLTDKLTPFYKWTESEATLNGVVRRLFHDVPTSMKLRVADPYVYESTHLRRDKVVKAHRQAQPRPDEVFKPEPGQTHPQQPEEIFKPEAGQFGWEIHKYLFAKERLNFRLNSELAPRIEIAAEIARSCCLWWNHADVVVMSERPTTIALDDGDRLHSVTGPSLCYGEGLRKYLVHGIEVEGSIIKDPVNCLTPDRIEKEHNVEVRRTLLELYGSERYLRQTGAQVIHEGRHGRRLWWRMPRESGVSSGTVADTIFSNSNEPLVMVEVKNSTPEPDGSTKIYFLRVAPHLRNADEAVAWTFGLTSAQYEPFLET